MTTPEAPALTALRAAYLAERAARLALEAEVAALAERNRRLDHLVQELRQAACGKRSRTLSADERQLSFEDLETAVAEVESAPVGARTARAPRLPRPAGTSAACRRTCPGSSRRSRRRASPGRHRSAIGPSDNGDAAAARWPASARTAPSGRTFVGRSFHWKLR